MTHTFKILMISGLVLFAVTDSGASPTGWNTTQSADALPSAEEVLEVIETRADKACRELSGSLKYIDQDQCRKVYVETAVKKSGSRHLMALYLKRSVKKTA